MITFGVGPSSTIAQYLLWELASVGVPVVRPDSSDIDAAIVARLSSDATLMALMPNLVYVDEAPPNMKRFVIVSLVDELDVQEFGGRSHEDAIYLVKAVGLSTTSPNMKAAAARIDELLDGYALTVTGYTPMVVQRESRVRQTEVDDADPSIRWQHRGGNYRVVMSW